MKRNFLIFTWMFIVLLNLAGFSFAETKKGKKSVRQINKIAVQNNLLAARLPASDAVVTIDLQRLMNVALPQILNAKPEMLTEMGARIDLIKAQTGIDLRQFEQVAVGINYNQTDPKKLDFLPVALAHGKYNANALLEAMKIIAKDTFREEKAGAKTIYIFKPHDIAANNKPQNGKPNILIPGSGIFINLDKIFAGEVAVGALDDNTLAFGKVERVRETFLGKSRLSPDILSLVGGNPAALVNFGGNAPSNLSGLLNLTGDDVFGKNIASIRQAYGSIDAANGNAAVSVTAKTTNAQQAEELETTVSGLQMLGKSMLGGMRGDDKKIYARMAENAKITRDSNKVMLNLQIPQSDIDALITKK